MLYYQVYVYLKKKLPFNKTTIQNTLLNYVKITSNQKEEEFFNDYHLVGLISLSYSHWISMGRIE